MLSTEQGTPAVMTISDDESFLKVLDTLKYKLGAEEDTRTVEEILLDPRTKAMAGSSTQQKEAIANMVRALKTERDRRKYEKQRSRTSSRHRSGIDTPWASRFLASFDCGNIVRSLVLASKTQRKKFQNQKSTPIVKMTQFPKVNVDLLKSQGAVFAMSQTNLGEGSVRIINLTDEELNDRALTEILMKPLSLNLQGKVSPYSENNYNLQYADKIKMIILCVNSFGASGKLTILPKQMFVHPTIVYLVPKSELELSEHSSGEVSNASSCDSVAKCTTTATQTSLSDGYSKCSSCGTPESDYSNGYRLEMMRRDIQNNPNYQQLLEVAEKIVRMSGNGQNEYIIRSDTKQCNFLSFDAQNLESSEMNDSSTTMSSPGSFETEKATEDAIDDTTGAKYLSQILCQTRMPNNYLTTPEIVVSCSDWAQDDTPSARDTSDECYFTHSKLPKGSSAETVVYRNCLSASDIEWPCKRMKTLRQNINLEDTIIVETGSDESSAREKLSLRGSKSSCEEIVNENYFNINNYVEEADLPSREESEINLNRQKSLSNEISREQSSICIESKKENEKTDAESDKSVENEALEPTREAMTEESESSSDISSLHSQRKTRRLKKKTTKRYKYSDSHSSTSSPVRMPPPRLQKIRTYITKQQPCSSFSLDKSKSKIKVKGKHKVCTMM